MWTCTVQMEKMRATIIVNNKHNRKNDIEKKLIHSITRKKITISPKIKDKEYKIFYF